MFDYRNNLKQILAKTNGDDQSLRNSLAAIKLIIGMTENEKDAAPSEAKNADSEKQQLESLFSSLAELLLSPGNSKAKKTALAAIHQLMFIQGNTPSFRQSVNRLEQAVRSSKTTKETINKKVFEKALEKKPAPKRDYRKGKRYTVIRLLSGCDLINDSNRRVFTLKESQIHALNLKSGDIVEALPEQNNSNYEAEILRVVGYHQLPSMEVDQISTFKYGVVQGRPGHYSVSRNIKGQKLRIRGKSILLPVDASKFSEGNVPLLDGSIVDLAWYDGDVRIKKDPSEAIKIRWIYEVDPPQTASKIKKKKVKSDKTEEELARLDLDLHYERVGIAVGDNQNEAILEGIVKSYHGIPFAIDAFQGKKKVIENQIKDLDIVILVTAFAAHDSTWNIREFASKYHVKFAVSSSKGFQSFERALYRAEKGLPAYEGNQTIEYQKLEQ